MTTLRRPHGDGWDQGLPKKKFIVVADYGWNRSWVPQANYTSTFIDEQRKDLKMANSWRKSVVITFHKPNESETSKSTKSKKGAKNGKVKN